MGSSVRHFRHYVFVSLGWSYFLFSISGFKFNFTHTTPFKQTICLTALLWGAAHYKFAFICMVNHDRPRFFLQWTTQYKGHISTWHPLYSVAKKPMQHLEGYSGSHDLISGVFSWTWPWLPGLKATAELHPFSYIRQQLALSASPLGSGKLKALCEFFAPLLSTTICQSDGQVDLLIWQESSSDTVPRRAERESTATAKESRAFTHLFKEKPGEYSG